jgi:predicted ATP-grasp superfamily ATP-dependent carboligase
LQVFIYEWVVGGGFLGRKDSLPESLPESLLLEGGAMLAAVAEDFSRLRSVEVHSIVQSSLKPLPNSAATQHVVESAADRDRTFDKLAAFCDATVIIAPEFEGILLGLSRRAVKAGGRLMSPGPEFIEVTSDKHETVIRLHAAGVRVPEGMVLMPGEMSPASIGYPAVLKPIEGAGSLGVQRLDSPRPAPSISGAYRLERFVEGSPASVAVVCGPESCVPLEPCTQRLATNGSFAYLGGSLPLSEFQRERARALALKAICSLPSTVGYVGVDLIIGNTEEDDAVIEINPRYTTSYVGLRAATARNLAKLVLDMSNGEQVPPPVFKRIVEFDSTGKVRLL